MESSATASMRSTAYSPTSRGLTPTDYDKKNKQQILNETAAYLVDREYLPDALYSLTFRGKRTW